MNRRDVFRRFGAASVAVMGLAVASPVATKAPMPNMTPGVPYCPTCDAERWLPERMAPGHVSTRFGRDRLEYDVYLNGEKINDAFEVMDGQWALRSDLRDFHAATCPRCRHALMQTLSLGPYDVRKADF